MSFPEVVDPAEVGLDAERLQRIDTHFRRYVDDERLPGWLITVARHGKLAHLSTYGWRDVEAQLPVEHDTIFRIFSMSKPITTVALMMLWEEGAFELKDPVHQFIPAFRDTPVYRGGSSLKPELEPQRSPMLVWHLLSHTAGLTYGFMQAHPCDAIYRARGYEWSTPKDMDLEAVCNDLATMPLVFQPGTEWNYSMATDVVGRLVEVLSGQTLDEFVRQRITGPLGMVDTEFWVPQDKQSRLGGLYVPNPVQHRRRVRMDSLGKTLPTRPTFIGGGGGMAGTAPDYLRFIEMLRRGGELDGVRLLSPRTVQYMTSNHLPGNVDLTAFGRSLFAETTFDGVGFGLGFSVELDPVATKVPGSPGEYGWGGAASTAFWIDPVDDLTVQFMTQLLPSSTWPIRSQLKQLVHQALLD